MGEKLVLTVSMPECQDSTECRGKTKTALAEGRVTYVARKGRDDGRFPLGFRKRTLVCATSFSFVNDVVKSRWREGDGFDMTFVGKHTP